MRLVWVRKEVVPDPVLSEEEQQRAALFRDVGARRTFVQARSTVRRLLGARLDCDPATLEIQVDEGGKPFVAGCEFNLSHSGDWILIGLTDGQAIGVDVEVVRDRSVRRISKRFFAEAEQLRVGEDPVALAEIWTGKESFLKATGTGIRRPLEGIDLARIGASEWIEVEGVRVRSVWAPPGYAAAMAVVDS